jgi:hypothetical protein
VLRRLAFILAFFSMAHILVAEEIKNFDGVDGRAKYNFEKEKFKESLKNKNLLDNKFWTIAGALTISSVLDVETTFNCINTRINCTESNSRMVGFLNSGRPATYGVQFAANIGAMAISYKMRKSFSARKFWWIMPALLITAHSIASGYNIQLTFKLPRK